MAFLDENGVAQFWAAIKSHVTTVSDTKFDKNKVVANYTTQGTGYALDASLGPAIKEKMDLADTLDTQLSTLKNNMKIYSVYTNGRQSVNFQANTAPIPGLSLTLDPGLYVIMGNLYFQGCSAGRQGITLTLDNTPGSNFAYAYNLQLHDSAYASNLYYNICNIEQYNSRTTIYLMGYDQRNEAVWCGGRLCAVRII